MISDATFISSEGDYLEAQIQVGGQRLIVMDCFGGEDFKTGEQIEIELSVGLAADECWDAIFSANPDAQQCLVPQIGWCYRAFGIVEAIDPEVSVHVGIATLIAPIETNDPQVIGQPIAWTIQRLDAHSIL